MAQTHTRLDKMEAFVKRMVHDNAIDASVIATTDRREALKDADYLAVMIQSGGVEEFREDYEIPLKYVMDQCIGDTMGLGEVFRALRHIPVLLEIANDMRELCIKAILFVQTTMDLVASYTGMAKNEIDFLCAGINHLGCFLKLSHQGRDLYF